MKAYTIARPLTRRGAAICWLVLLAFCPAPSQAGSAEEIHEMGLAPWSGAKVGLSEIPSVYVAEWNKAENRDRCALLVLEGLSKSSEFRCRRANFGGGWAVAYDSATERSVFGIAGSGTDVDSPDPVYRFPFTRRWTDGSVANYGLEGGVGPGYLAYLHVSGQKCLYNVWSKRGRAHLESLIERIRFVDHPQDSKHSRQRWK